MNALLSVLLASALCAGTPWKCPSVASLQSKFVRESFDVAVFANGQTYYELAYKDVTQPRMCDCITSRKVLSGSVILDDFTIQCAGIALLMQGRRTTPALCSTPPRTGCRCRVARCWSRGTRRDSQRFRGCASKTRLSTLVSPKTERATSGSWSSNATRCSACCTSTHSTSTAKPTPCSTTEQWWTLPTMQA